MLFAPSSLKLPIFEIAEYEAKTRPYISADAYRASKHTHKQESVASFTRAPSAQLVLLEHLLHASMAPRHILNHAHQVELAKARRAEHRRHLLRLLH